MIVWLLSALKSSTQTTRAIDRFRKTKIKTKKVLIFGIFSSEFCGLYGILACLFYGSTHKSRLVSHFIKVDEVTY